MSILTINDVRFLYNFVFEPKLNKQNGKEEYFIRVLVPKTNKRAIEAIKQAVKEEAEDKWGNRKAEQILNSDRVPLHDGDIKKKGDPIYEGMMYFNAKTNNRPNVVDIKLNPIMDKEEFYSGCWGAFNGTVWAYDNEYGKGLSISVDNLMKNNKDDDKLVGSGISAQQAFAGFADTSEADDEVNDLL